MKRYQIVIFVSIVLVIQYLTSLVVYEGALLIFRPDSAKAILAFRILLGLSTIAFVAIIFITNFYNNFLTRLLYHATAIWQGLLLYLFLASTIFLLAFALINAVPLNFGLVLFGLALITTIYGVIKARIIEIKNIQVKLNNLPLAWKTKKVIFISDLHLGQINTEWFATKVTALLQQQKPDLVFIGGDLYDGVKVQTQKIIEPLKQLQPIDSIYFITGNHDGFTEHSMLEDLAAIEQSGIKIIRDQLIEIDGVQIIGVDYKNNIRAEKFAEMLKNLNINRSKPSILLKHVPDNIEVAAQAGISLQLSGHTHRAQSWPLSYLPKLIFKGFDYGLNSLGNLQVYTSSGVGTWGPPLRVGTESEIVIINFI